MSRGREVSLLPPGRKQARRQAVDHAATYGPCTDWVAETRHLGGGGHSTAQDFFAYAQAGLAKTTLVLDDPSRRDDVGPNK